MPPERSGDERLGLERTCAAGESDWIRHSEPVGGVELLEAWLRETAYRTHRHDTYAIGLTETGVQAFDYRGSGHVSLPGQVVVLHPDEPHDGRAGTEDGFGYRLVYVEPALVAEAIRDLRGPGWPLPFVRDPVVASSALATAVQAAFRDDRDPLALDDLVARLAEGLLVAALDGGQGGARARLDLVAIGRARQFLDAETGRVVRSGELEAVTGLTRYDLARQFRALVGTSPYRYSLMRRLGHARALVARRRPLADVALEAGFADQAHLTRAFVAAFGITPARYAALSAERAAGR